MSWQGHQQQFEAQQRRLRNAIDKYNDRGCGQKMPVPAYANIEAQRATPSRPLSHEVSAFDRWIGGTSISDQALNNIQTGALVTAGAAATVATAGLAGPYVAGALAGVGGTAALAY